MFFIHKSEPINNCFWKSELNKPSNCLRIWLAECKVHRLYPHWANNQYLNHWSHTHQETSSTKVKDDFGIVTDKNVINWAYITLQATLSVRHIYICLKLLDCKLHSKNDSSSLPRLIQTHIKHNFYSTLCKQYRFYLWVYLLNVFIGRNNRLWNVVILFWARTSINFYESPKPL